MDYFLYIIDYLQYFVKTEEFVRMNVYFSFSGILLFIFLFIIYPIILGFLKKENENDTY